MDVVTYLVLSVGVLFLLLIIVLLCSIMGRLDGMQHSMDGLHRGFKLMRDHQFKRDLREVSNPVVKVEDLEGHIYRDYMSRRIAQENQRLNAEDMHQRNAAWYAELDRRRALENRRHRER